MAWGVDEEMTARKIHYVAIVDKDPDSDFSVLFPDFPRCVSAGDTLDEAILNAHEALAGHVSHMLADGEALPPPTPVQQLVGQHDATTVAITVVPVVLPGQIKRVNITLDEGLLEEIDSMTDNRSRFLADAARAELARRRAI